MKYNILKYATLFLGSLLTVTSCIEEGENQVDGVGKSRFRVPLADNYSLVSLDSENPTAGIFTVYRDAVSNSDLNTAVTLNYTIDPDKLDEYNTAEETEILLLDPAIYTFTGASAGTIQFAAGEATKEIVINLDISTINFSERYALPFVFSSTGIEVSKTSEFAIIEVGVKNQFDGVYNYTGHIGRYDGTSCELIELGGPVDAGITVSLTTTGQYSVSMVSKWATGGNIGGIGSAQIADIDPETNQLTFTAVGASPANWAPIAGQPNYYDPETGDIYISYRWGAVCSGALYGFTRHINVKLTYKGSR